MRKVRKTIADLEEQLANYKRAQSDSLGVITDLQEQVQSLEETTNYLHTYIDTLMFCASEMFLQLRNQQGQLKKKNK